MIPNQVKKIRQIKIKTIKCSCGCGNKLLISYDRKDKNILFDIEDSTVRFSRNHNGKCKLVGIAIYGKELKKFLNYLDDTNRKTNQNKV
jgi:hypothetical protein